MARARRVGASLALAAVGAAAALEESCRAAEGRDDGCVQAGGAGSQPPPSPPPLCGAWCSPEEAAAEACEIDQALMPCRGEHCTSTCGLWARSMLWDLHSHKISCQHFAWFVGYPRGAEVCKPECVLPEIRPDRYPAPTGLGLLCRPGTCEPSTQSRFGNRSLRVEGLGVLSCPCNWFGSDCRDDWLPVRTVKKTVLGDFQLIELGLDREDWQRALADHRPGGVVRLQRVDAEGVPREQPYALATGREGQPGVLEVLAGLPEEGMNPSVVEVANWLRAQAEGPVSGLYANPSVAGFFNRRNTFLLQALAETGSPLQHVALASTGAGLAGVRSAMEQLLSSGLQLHIYYGLRDLRHLPYRDLLTSWSKQGARLVLLASGPAQPRLQEPGLALAQERGERLQAAAGGRKVYAQQALELDLSPRGHLAAAGADLSNTVVVVCGRAQLLREVPRVLEASCEAGGRDAEECRGLLAERVFTNI